MAPIQSPFTEEHEAFRRTCRDWVEKELAPHALEWDRAGIFPREVFKRAGELGFLGVHYPESGRQRAATTGTWWRWARSWRAAATPA